MLGVNGRFILPKRRECLDTLATIFCCLVGLEEEDSIAEELELELMRGGRCESVGDACFELDLASDASTATSRDPHTCQSS
jgi:hypothetical protein